MKKSQLCYAVWPWGSVSKEQTELALTEITEIGYKKFESVKQAGYAYDLDPVQYTEMLNRFGVSVESFYFHLPSKGEEDGLFATLEKELEFLQKLGITRATLQGVYGRPEGDVMTEEARQHNLNLMIKFATIAKKYGVKTNVHPHVDTYFMYEDEIDYVMENTDKDLIYFAPDTAHIAAAGADPVEVVKRYADRVNFTHLKDYKVGDEITSQGWVESGVPIMSCFHALGQGTVDFKEIIKVLDEAGYDGPLCIELDKSPISHADSAKKSYDYLSQFLED